MSPDERKKIRTGQSGTDDLYNKLLELQDLAKGYWIFEDLSKVIELLDDGNNSNSDNAKGRNSNDGNSTGAAKDNVDGKGNSNDGRSTGKEPILIE